MSEKNLKSLRFHGLDDIYKIPSTAEDVGAATLEEVSSAKTSAVNESKTYTNAQVKKAAPRNLLDNSDFRNPVNQRGQQNYTGSGDRDVYTIDRWYFGWQGGATLTVSPDGYIQKSAHEFTQAIENVDLTKTYTGAICLKDGTKYVYSGKVDNGFGDWGNTIWVWTNNGRIYFGIHSGITQPIAWAALYEGEYTIDTLPEYQSKGYAVELAECQRYFRRFTASNMPTTIYRAGSENPIIFTCLFFMGVGMRTSPTVTLEAAPSKIRYGGKEKTLADVSFYDLLVVSENLCAIRLTTPTALEHGYVGYLTTFTVSLDADI